jgi:hypothetical protein
MPESTYRSRSARNDRSAHIETTDRGFAALRAGRISPLGGE